MKVEGMKEIFKEVVKERERCIEHFLTRGLDIHRFDEKNTLNDWVAYITTYAGRASEKVLSNPQEFRKNIIKVLNIGFAAIQAYDIFFTESSE